MRLQPDTQLSEMSSQRGDSGWDMSADSLSYQDGCDAIVIFGCSGGAAALTSTPVWLGCWAERGTDNSRDLQAVIKMGVVQLLFFDVAMVYHLSDLVPTNRLSILSWRFKRGDSSGDQ